MKPNVKKLLQKGQLIFVPFRFISYQRSEHIAEAKLKKIYAYKNKLDWNNFFETDSFLLHCASSKFYRYSDSYRR